MPTIKKGGKTIHLPYPNEKTPKGRPPQSKPIPKRPKKGM